MHNSNFLRMPKEPSRDKTALVIKIAVTIVPLLVIYWQDLELVFREALLNDFMNYMLIIPLLAGYLVYRKRRVLNAFSSLGTDQKKSFWTVQLAAAAGLFALSFLTYFQGAYTSQTLEYHLLSLPLFLAAIIALVFNLQTLKALLFPIALLFFIQPYFIQLVNPFWSDLSWMSSTAAYNFLSIIGIPAKFTTVLDVPTIEITTVSGEVMPFTVGVASSGLNSFMGFTVFSIFVVYILRDALWKRVTLMLAGYPMLILLNTVRITIILGLAYQWGIAVAEVFHLTGGLILIFIGTLLLLLMGEKLWKVTVISSKQPQRKCASCEESLIRGNSFCTNCGRFLKSIKHTFNKQVTLKIAIVMLMSLLFFVIQTPPVVQAKSPTEIDLTNISVTEVERLLPMIPNWNLRFLYRDTRVEEILKQDAALVFAYVSTQAEGQIYHATIFVGVQISVNRHTWEASLITWPARYGRPAATVFDLRDIPILQNPALTGRFFAFQRPQSNQTEIVLYWFERVPFKIGSVWDVRNVQISMLSYTDQMTESGLISNSSDFARVEEIYLPMAQVIANYWQPIKTSSYVTAVMSNYGDRLLIITVVALVIVANVYALQRRRERKANVKVYQKLSGYDQKIIDMVRRTEKKGVPTLENIAATYQNVVRPQLNRDQLLLRLTEIEKMGLVKRTIVSRQDQPVEIWRAQILLG